MAQEETSEREHKITHAFKRALLASDIEFKEGLENPNGTLEHKIRVTTMIGCSEKCSPAVSIQVLGDGFFDVQNLKGEQAERYCKFEHLEELHDAVLRRLSLYYFDREKIPQSFLKAYFAE